MVKNNRPNLTSRAIVIRKRTQEETRDLALSVLCRKFKTLAFYYSILAIPALLIDLVLWGLFAYSLPYGERGAIAAAMNFEHWLYFFVVWLTVSLETAFVGSLVTQYLGLWLFELDERTITPSRVFKEWRKHLGQLLHYLVFFRILSIRLFYAETILLEQTPYRGSKSKISTRRRLRNIGQTFLDNFTTESYLSCGILTGYFLVAIVATNLVPDAVPALLVLDFITFPVFVFGCRLFNVVYSFFSYINYRVSSEGWDLELAFRDELNRLLGEDETESETSKHGTTRSSKTLGALVMDSDWLETERTSKEIAGADSIDASLVGETSAAKEDRS